MHGKKQYQEHTNVVNNRHSWLIIQAFEKTHESNCDCASPAKHTSAFNTCQATMLRQRFRNAKRWPELSTLGCHGCDGWRVLVNAWSMVTVA